MGRLSGGLMVLVGMGLWYYGGTSGNSVFVNLGMGSIILGLVLAVLPSGVDRGSLFITCESFCSFLKNIEDELGLNGKAVIVPPNENLPRGGLFLTKSPEFSISLGRFREGEVFVVGTDRESGVLVSPPPGWNIVEYVIDNVGDLRATGLGYASSAVSSAISALGIGSAEVFEKEGELEVFVKPVCTNPHADPVLMAVLLGVAMGIEELLLIDSVDAEGDHFRARVKRMGGVEEWL